MREIVGYNLNISQTIYGAAWREIRLL